MAVEEATTVEEYLSRVASESEPIELGGCKEWRGPKHGECPGQRFFDGQTMGEFAILKCDRCSWEDLVSARKFAVAMKQQGVRP